MFILEWSGGRVRDSSREATPGSRGHWGFIESHLGAGGKVSGRARLSRAHGGVPLRCVCCAQSFWSKSV